MATRARIFLDTTLQVRLTNLRRADDSAPITALDGVDVSATIYNHATNAEIATVVLSADDEVPGNWAGAMDADALSNAGIVKGDKVDLKWLADGGPGLTSTWWERDVRVLERDPESDE